MLGGEEASTPSTVKLATAQYTCPGVRNPNSTLTGVSSITLAVRAFKKNEYKQNKMLISYLNIKNATVNK